MEERTGRLCDLHTHSVFSDGTFTPTEIIDEAIRIGLSAVALCDHNTVDGLPEFMSAAKNRGIEAVPGAEFSVFYKGRELHLLGLFIPEGSYAYISDLMNDGHERKEKSNLELIAALSEAGIHLDYDLIKSSTTKGRVNRAHIAAEMTKKGYTDSIKDAFTRYLSPSAGFYKEPRRISIWDTIDMLQGMGAVSVLAHPFLNMNESELRELLPLAKARGLEGIECFYPLYDNATTELSTSIAREFGLLPSGGSDFHGGNKPDIMLGKGKGSLIVPFECFTELKRLSINE